MDGPPRVSAPRPAERRRGAGRSEESQTCGSSALSGIKGLQLSQE